MTVARDHALHTRRRLLRLVRQHRPGDHVADGVDARHAGAEVRADLNAAAPLVLRPMFSRLRPSVWGAAHRDQAGRR